MPEELPAQRKTHSAAQRRLEDFWGFVDKHLLGAQVHKGLAVASTDYVDQEFPLGGGFEVGERPLAALERWALVARRSRSVVLPRYRRALWSWRRNNPSRSWRPLPGKFMWLPTGALVIAGEVVMTWYPVYLSDTYLRPTALLWLFTDDVIVSPVERDAVTNANTSGETVLLDGSLVPNPGELLALQVERQERKSAADENAAVAEGGLSVPLGDSTACRMSLRSRGEVTMLGFQKMETLFRCQRGGASRGLPRKRRAETETQERLHHASAGSSRTYRQPGRLSQPGDTPDPTTLSFASRIRDSYSKFFLAGRFPDQPVALSRFDLS